MRTLFSRISGMTAQQRAALSEEFSRAARTTMAEPVAVVGIGCRFPGDVTGPDSFWELLVDGRNAISGIPADRWDAEAFYAPDPLTPGHMTTKWGGFVPDIAGFDAEFFGITPREAASMDPQQRMLLEVAWEALEHAGIPTDSLGGTRTGVMMGVYFNEYQSMLASSPDEVDAYTGTGNSHSITAGRISYMLGLRGPAVAVDTACSSSLAAIHLACQSLRVRESDLALAGGVSVTLRPETQIAISAWGLLSPHGRCATFDAAADGFVRGEGAGVVVLKRLTDAVRDGDQVLAVVRGSAVNQDGRSNGITAPNTAAQCDVIADALRSADVAPESVHYVESHGTGTALGDPIEFEALAATYGRGEGSCALGAVKTNIGHLEAALGNGRVHQGGARCAARPDPTESALLAVESGNRRVVNAAFRSRGKHRVAAGCGSAPGGGVLVRFGWHECACGDRAGARLVPVTARSPDTEVSTLVVSGKTPERVAATASMLADWMEGPGAGVALADVAHTLNHHRARQTKFGTVVRPRPRPGGGRVAGVGRRPARPRRGGPARRLARAPGTVFVYSGRGSQWAGMGRQLLADEPAFADAIAELEPVFVEQAGFSLHDVIAGGKELVGIEQIQLGLIGMQLALTELWRSYGVHPDVVIGHSMGEVAAAVVAGALTPAEGLRVTATRSRLMAPLSGQGGMALLGLDAAATEALIADYPQVTLGIYISPRQTVIAGPTAADRCSDRRGARAEPVRQPGQYRGCPAQPGHGCPATRRCVRSWPIWPRRRRPFRSSPPRMKTSTARPVFDAEYWATNMRNPVRFQQAITAAGTDHHTFIEISAHPMLTQAIMTLWMTRSTKPSPGQVLSSGPCSATPTTPSPSAPTSTPSTPAPTANPPSGRAAPPDPHHSVATHPATGSPATATEARTKLGSQGRNGIAVNTGADRQRRAAR